MTPPHVLVATGFNREAAIAAGPGVVAVAGGGVPARLEERLEAHAAGARGILSFGLTGALADGLAVGQWIVATRLAGAVEMETDARWREALLSRLPEARAGIFYADGRMIDSVAEKRALGLRTGALAVDMESHIAAGVARRHGLPFAILRAVSDGVEHRLPHAITVCMRPDGGIDAGAMLRSLATRPGQLPGFVSTVANAAKGFRALARGHVALGFGMGFPDFGDLALDQP